MHVPSSIWRKEYTFATSLTIYTKQSRHGDKTTYGKKWNMVVSYFSKCYCSSLFERPRSHSSLSYLCSNVWKFIVSEIIRTKQSLTLNQLATVSTENTEEKKLRLRGAVLALAPGFEAPH